jgi:hypothetical protein
MTAISRGVAVGLLLLVPLSAQAWGHRAQPVTASYYYTPLVAPTASYYYYPLVAPAPVVSAYYYPQPIPVVVAPPAPVVVAAPAPVYAVPTPAPACPPAVNESRSNSSPIVRTSARVANGTARVTFWNHSPQELTLRIDGEVRTVARGRGLTLELPRKFIWQINDRPAEGEQVPDGEPALDILIRR